MDYLGRGSAPFGPELWSAIDEAVTAGAKETMVARRFLPLCGPLGPRVNVTKIDPFAKQEVFEDGLASMTGRVVSQVPQLYEDFWLYWRDLEEGDAMGCPTELGVARNAGEKLAFHEDKLVFYGAKALGIDGLLTAKGVNSIKRGDWATGESSFTDVATGIALLLEKGKIGKHTLVLSQDLFVQIQRITPGTGELESERIKKLLDGRLFASPVLKPKTAMLLSAQPQYLDLLIGQDVATAYLELVDLNHHMRVLETALPRIKAPEAIVVYT